MRFYHYPTANFRTTPLGKCNDMYVVKYVLEFYVLIGKKRIRVVRPNMRVKNGVVHIIEEVIFDPTDLKTGQSISRASRFVDSLPVIVLSFSFMFVYFRRVFPQL